MNNSGFLSSVAQRVRDIGRVYGLTDDRAFLVWAAGLLWGLEEEEAVEGLLDRPNDKFVDLFWYDDPEQRVIIAQGKYSRDGKRHAKVKDLSAFPSCIHWLAKPQALQEEGLPDLADAARQFTELRQRDVAVELWFVTFSPGDKNLDKEADIFNRDERNAAERIQLRVASLDTLRSLFEDAEDAGGRVQEDSFSVTWAGAQVGSYGQAMVATVKGAELAALYARHRNKLFGRDVRLFLGERQGSVNKGIADTLHDNEDRGNFWAYNNGVTMVCHRLDYDPDAKRVRLLNFSVVNGCQTTVSLHRAGEAVADDVEVLLKIVNPKNEVIDRIIEFTNSQNQIRKWDIKSQDRVQRRLRDNLMSLAPPFFYVIRKGEFEALPADEKKKYRVRGGQKRVIQFDSVAQYLAAMRGNSYHAYKFKARLFENLYGEVFPPNIDAKQVVFAWQLGELVRGFVRETVSQAASEGDEQKARILKKGARIYLISVVELLMRLRNGDVYLSRVADGQPFGSLRKEKLLKYCLWAFDWYQEAVEHLIESGNQDLNTLVRQENFIDRVNERVRREYDRMKRARKYFEEALPRLLPAKS